ncbi:hypothetical protein [Streptomyces sp. NPDC002088]|uniref:hypothetical protein n=1 Tax=Streptomyces sp. NPDC002088 TaxID=3154665 RepID=UPI00332CA49E
MRALTSIPHEGKAAFAEALRVLEEQARYRTGDPKRSRAKAIKEANDTWQDELPTLTTSTVWEWVQYGRAPQDFRRLWAFVSVLLVWSGRPVTRADRDLWRRRWTLAQATGSRRPPSPALPPAHLVPEQQRLGRPVSEAGPFALDVHEASDIGGDARLPLLPAYVRRDHDDKLAEVVASAMSRSAMAVLVGDSSTGKTRALWEAIQGLPTGWLLWLPRTPTPPRSLLEGLTERLVGPQTVVWLNDTQHYLNTELGEQIAVALRELLDDPDRAPVLVLGTLWREHHGELSRPPTAWRDPHPQARQLLRSVGVLSVSDTFSAEETRQAAASDDPRLTRAAGESGGRITQFLAGVPELRRRYETAPATVRAVLDAAIDIRRCGHGPDISSLLLEEAAFQLLDDVTLSTLKTTWITKALDYTSAPCYGVRGLVTATRPSQSHYRLSDIIEQEGRQARASSVPLQPFWEVLRRHADAPELVQIGSEAQTRGLFHEASLFYMAAVRSGHRRAAWSLASMLEGCDRVSEAVRWYRWCAESGVDDDAYARVAWLTDRFSDLDPEDSIRWLRKQIETAPERGSTTSTEAALEALANLLEDRRDELNRVLSHHYGVDDETELRELGDRLAYLKDDPVPLRYWDDDELHIGSLMSGPNPAIIWIGDPLVRAGRIDEAIHHYQSFSGESTYAMRQAVRLMQQAGRTEEATDWLRRELSSGNERALWITAEVLARTGHAFEAEQLRRYGVEPDDSIARPWTAEPSCLDDV